MKDADNENENGGIRPNYKGGSPLSLEAKQVYLKNKTLIEGLVKKVAVEKDNIEDSLLDENKLKE
jgi:hypothetical protein